MAAKKYSLAIRITTGVVGLAGLVAIGVNAVQAGGLDTDALSLFLLFAKLFAAYIFLYVAIFGSSPLAFLDRSERD